MKHFLLLFFLYVLNFNSFSQFQLNIAEYPPVSLKTTYSKLDLSTCEKLISDGLPRKAYDELRRLEKEAITTKNVKAYWAILSELSLIINQAQFEQEEHQKIIWDYANQAEKLEFPFNNILHLHLYKWVETNRWNENLFTFDDESLLWPIDGKQVKLVNENLVDLIHYHQKMLLDKPSELMKIELSSILEKNELTEPKSMESLFEFFANSIISETDSYFSENNIKDSLYYGYTDELPTATDFYELKHFTLQLYYHLEKLTLTNNRYTAYAYWVGKRLNDVYQFSTAEKINDFDKDRLLDDAFLRFEELLSQSKASILFTLQIVNNLSKKADTYHWKNNSKFKNNNLLALTKIETTSKKFPDNDFKVELTRLKNHILSNRLSFSIKNELVLNQSILLNVNYRNVSSSLLKIYKIENEKITNSNSNPLKNYTLTPYFSKEITLEKDSFYLNHDIDFILPKITETGKYLFILAKDAAEIESILVVDSLYKKNHFAYQVYNLSEINSITNNDNGTIHFLITNKKNGLPIHNATITLTQDHYYSEQNQEASKIIFTDKNGMATFKAFSSYKYQVKYEKDSLDGRFYAYRNYEQDTVYTYKAYLDRGIYRPGQNGFIKILGFHGKDNDFKVNADEEAIELEIKDNNDQVLFQKEINLNEFGTAFVAFQLPSSGFLFGNLSILLDGEYIESFKVEEYKRPTFKVDFEEITGKVKLGDSLKVVGTVKAFAGYPISNAKVHVNITQSNYFPRWCDVNYEDRISYFDTLISTDQNGNFNIHFLPKNKKYSYGSNFRMNAIVTDISGEVQENTTSIFVGNQSYSIQFDVDENILSTKENSIQPMVTNSENIEIKDAFLTYSIVKLNQKDNLLTSLEEAEYKNFNEKEFQNLFPSYIYFSKKLEPQTDTLSSGKLKSSDQLYLNQFIQKQGAYKIQFTTIDENGEKSVAERTINYIIPTSKKGQHSSNLWMIASKTTVKAGDEIELIIGSSHKKLNVYFEIKNDQSVTTGKWIKLKGRKIIKYKITEKDKNGLTFNILTFKNNQFYQQQQTIQFINEDKKLKVQLASIKDYLKPGSQEKWSVTIKDNILKNIPSELLVAMHDASLNQLNETYWDRSFYYYPGFSIDWSNSVGSNLLYQNNHWNNYYMFTEYEGNNYIGKAYNYSRAPLANRYGEDSSASDEMAFSEPIMALEEVQLQSVGNSAGSGGGKGLGASKKSKDEEAKPVTPRTNFNETAFFYPSIYTDSSGNYRFEFTLPDALTTWQFRALATTKDLKVGYYEHSFEAKKELMVEPNEPRFFRENDEFVFSSKVVNMTEKIQEVTMKLTFIDPMTDKVSTALFGSINDQKVKVPANSSAEVSWKINIPEDKFSLIAYQIEASNAQFGDAERKAIPILSNKQLVVEAMPFVKTSKGEQAFTLEKLKNLSSTAQKISYTLEMQTQPMWTTLMSLPYLIEFPYECAEQTFARYFGNVLAQKIIKDNPAFKRIIETWKQTNPNAFLSELEKNKELKSILLTETPWLLDAQNETAQRNHLATLFDENTLQNNINGAIEKLSVLKSTDGGWSWFGNHESNVYITQHIVSGFGQLKQLGIPYDEEMVQSAVAFLEQAYMKEFNDIKKENREKLVGLSSLHVHWLTARSYFDMKETEASKYYHKCLEKEWKNFDLQTQVLAGISFLKTGNKAFAEKIKNSILDRATQKPEMGMYWNANKSGYYWNQSPIETQSYIIQFFTAMSGLDKEVQQMQLWLLRNKQANAWETTKATTLACHALLINKMSIANQLNQEVSVRFNDGTNLGVLKKDANSTFVYNGIEITAGKSTVNVSTTADQPVFGAMYLKYLEKMDNIEKSTGEMRIERHYYWMNNGKEEEVLATTTLPIGTKIIVKMTIRSNQAMEFVHIKDSKASGFESREKVSSYKYSTVSYYQINKDASTELFIDYLPKGNHLFEYELFVTEKGSLTVGTAEVESMYAPMYRGVSGGMKVLVR
ncbi:MAG: hypothetical protein HYR91_04860 [Flavobacteriia bacterium]|nr:hypothetical protein [Flavobacteriia bacterium]